jgi:hypothetical protein
MGTLNPREQFADGDSLKIDKVIAASAITGYVGGVKMLKTLKGNVDLQGPTVFERYYAKYQNSHTDVEKSVDDIAGFVDRDAEQPIKLRRPGRTAMGNL